MDLIDHLKVQVQVAFVQVFNNSHLKIQVQVFNNIQLPYLGTFGPANCGWIDGIPEPNVMRHCPTNIISIILFRLSNIFRNMIGLPEAKWEAKEMGIQKQEEQYPIHESKQRTLSEFMR